MVERRHADIARTGGGGELVNAKRWNHSIAGTVAREWHATYLIVAIDVGDGHQTQLVLRGNVCGSSGWYAHLCMASVSYTVGSGKVVSPFLDGETLVKRIIDGQSSLVAGKRMVIVS